jgi:hypothetical protein
MRCVHSSPLPRCSSAPLIAERRRHQELEKTLLEVVPGCDAEHTFLPALLRKRPSENCSMLPRFMGSRDDVSERHPTDLAS